MAPAVAAGAMTRITLSFMLSLLSDNNFQGPDAPVNSKYHWAYRGPEGPEFWHLHYKFCAGDRQSPINIVTSFTEYDPSLNPIVLNNFDVMSAANGPCLLNVTNNGHAASIRVTNDDMWIQGGGLGQRYRTVEFHFHWGNTDEVGSEHALNGRKYPLEMHVVNFAEKYGTVKQAMTQPDGLAVLGVFFELSEKDNPNFAAIDEALRHVQKAGDHTTVNQLYLRSLLPEDLSKFWRYNGSLTTPFCFESVVWTVFAEPLKISKIQLETLRTLLHEEDHDIKDRGKHQRSYTPSRLLENWRPTQALNGRIIKRSFVDTGGGGTLVNKPSSDIKLPSYDISVPTMSNFDDASAIIVGGTNLNADPLIPPSFSPSLPLSYDVHKPLTSEARNVASPSTNIQTNNPTEETAAQIKQNSHINIEASPVTVKYLISNAGSGFAVGNSSDAFSNSALFQSSSSNTDSSALETSRKVSQFGHLHVPNSAKTSSGDIEISKNVQVLQLGHTPSNAAAHTDLPQNTNSNSFQMKAITSIPNEFPITDHIQQKQSNTETKVVSSSSNNRQSSAPIYAETNNQNSVQIVSSPPPQKVEASAERPSSQSQRSQQKRFHADQQRQPLPTNKNINSRVGTMDSRIAELANQIRLHRLHGHAQNRHQNKSQAIFSSGLPSPPVVRHNQHQRRHLAGEPSQSPFYKQSRQHSDLLRQRQQIQQLNRPPNAQQLREILGKLAATSRINARPSTLLTSGAASILQRKETDPNSISGSSNNPQQSFPSTDGTRLTNNKNENAEEIHQPSSVAASSRSFWTNPTVIPVWQNQKSPELADPYWTQQSQSQQLPANEPYLQPTQTQTHPNQFSNHALPSSPNYGFSNPIQDQLGTNVQQGSIPPVQGNTNQDVYLNHYQHPVRLRRPYFDQFNDFIYRQYQTTLGTYII